MSDVHPLALALDDDDLRIEHSCFEEPEPFIYDGDVTYTDGDGRLANPRTYEWNHSIGEIVTAVLEHGLRLERLTEHDWDHLPRFPWLIETADHRWEAAAGTPRVPLSFTIPASRPK